MDKIDIDKIRKAFDEILDAMGDKVNTREDLKDTPKKISESYLELFSGIYKDPAEPLSTTYKASGNDLIIEKNIDFSSMCEHHFLPFFGKITVAYFPKDKIVGFGSIIRVIEILSKRPQIQERLTKEIADIIYTSLNCLGVAVIIEATHTCMTMRGIKKENSKIVTSAYRGTLDSDANKRAEFFSLIK